MFSELVVLVATFGKPVVTVALKSLFLLSSSSLSFSLKFGNKFCSFRFILFVLALVLSLLLSPTPILLSFSTRSFEGFFSRDDDDSLPETTCCEDSDEERD